MGGGLAIGQGKIISDDSDSARLEVVAVYLVAQARRRAKVLQVAVEGVGEVQLSITGVDDNIVERVELTAEVVVEEDLKNESSESSESSSGHIELTCGIVRGLGVHEVKGRGGVGTLTLASKDDVASVIRTT